MMIDSQKVPNLVGKSCTTMLLLCLLQKIKFNNMSEFSACNFTTCRLRCSQQGLQACQVYKEMQSLKFFENFQNLQFHILQIATLEKFNYISIEWAPFVAQTNHNLWLGSFCSPTTCFSFLKDSITKYKSLRNGPNA